MFKKVSTAVLTAAIAIAANGNAFAASNGDNKDEAAAAAVKAERAAEAKRRFETAPAATKKPFDPASQKSTMAEYERSKAAGKKLSTTTKVLIGVGIAAAVIAIVFVVAKDDLEDNILR